MFLSAQESKNREKSANILSLKMLGVCLSSNLGSFITLLYIRFLWLLSPLGIVTSMTMSRVMEGGVLLAKEVMRLLLYRSSREPGEHLSPESVGPEFCS